jgi:HD-like signal output (HDOD) protein
VVSTESSPGPAVEYASSLDFLSDMAANLAAGNVDLPAFPQVVINVQEALENPSYTPQTIARVISAERTLADRVLQMANSTAFNATGRVIIDLGVAVTRLGAQKVYSVAIAHAIQHIRRSELLRSIDRPLDELWSESVAVAHFSQALAKRTSLSAPDAFAAGLLHGMGRLYILMQCVGNGKSRPPLVVSNHLVDAWHPAIAKAVLKNWNMGEAVYEAVGAQADLHVRRGPPTLTDVLVASIRLAKRQQNRHDITSLNAGGALARLNLPLEACHALLAEADAEIRALQRALRP